MKKLLTKFKQWRFNKSAKKRAGQVLGTLALAEGQRVADIGSGGGYFVRAFSKRVGQDGHVYAVDTNKELLDVLVEYAGKKGLTNVTPVHIPDGGVPDLPEGALDLIFSRDSYHHIEVSHVGYFRELKRFLKPQGRVAIIDYKPEHLHRIFGHATGPEVIKRELAAAGYELVEEYDFLPTQSFFIFQPR